MEGSSSSLNGTEVYLKKKKIPRKNGSLRLGLSTKAVEGFVGGSRFKSQ